MQRDRAAGWVSYGQKWKTELGLGDNIYWYYAGNNRWRSAVSEMQVKNVEVVRNFFSHCRLYIVCHSVKNFLIFFHFQLALDCVAALQPLVRIFAIYAVNGFYGAGLWFAEWWRTELRSAAVSDHTSSCADCPCAIFTDALLSVVGLASRPCSAVHYWAYNNALHYTVDWPSRLLTTVHSWK